MNSKAASVAPAAFARQEQAVGPQTSLRTNFLWALLGNFVYGGCQWVMLVLIAKLGTPEMVGTFALAFALTAPVIQFANCNLRALQATDARGSFEVGDYVALRIASLVLAGGVIALVTVVAGYPKGTVLVIAVVAVAKIVESLSDVLFGVIQRHEHMSLISGSLIMKGVASVVALGVGLYVGESLAWGVVGLVCAWAAVLLAYDIPNGVKIASTRGQSLMPRWRGDAFARLATTAAPLGGAAMMASLQTSVPRIFVERYLGPRELGFFAAIAYLVIVGARVVTALGEAASPRLARYWSEGSGHDYLKTVAMTLAAGAAVGAFAVFIAARWGGRLLSTLYRPEYGAYEDVLLYVIGAAALGYLALFLQYAMTAARRIRSQVAILGASLLAVAGGCLFFIERLGATGAALAMMLGAGIQMVGNAVVVRGVVSEMRRARQ